MAYLDSTVEYMSKSNFWRNLGSKINNFFGSLFNRVSGTALTSAEREANSFTHNERLEAQDYNAAEAQKSRDFTEYMTRNKYAMETQSMEDAGLNPAMVYGGGSLVPTAANGAAGTSSGGTSVSPNDLNPLDFILSLIRFPKQLQELDAQIQERRASASESLMLGQAALDNAETNRINAGTQKGELRVHERLANVAEYEADIKNELKDWNIKVSDAEIKQLAAVTRNLDKQTSVIERYVVVAERNASSNEKNAVAAIRTSLANYKNALTNESLSIEQKALYKAEALLKAYEGDARQILNRYLDERQQQELSNLEKEGFKIDAQRGLIDKQGNVATAQQIYMYTSAACNISNAVNKWFNPLAGMSGGEAPISPDMLYGNLGTFYE